MVYQDDPSAVEIFATFPNIPQDLVKFVQLCLQRNHHNRLTYLLLKNPIAFSETLDKFFSDLSRLTGLTPDVLLRTTGFNFRDMDPTRIEAAIAELRCIFFLDEEGFVGISPLQSKGTKGADFTAQRGTTRYAIEVANSVYDAKRRVSPDQLKDWLIGRYYDDEKAAQLRATADALSCQRRVLVGVVNTKAAIAFNVHPDFCTAAHAAWVEAKSDPDLHIWFVTGTGEPFKYGRDDCVYPEWP